jgi:hypothetical protein
MVFGITVDGAQRRTQVAADIESPWSTSRSRPEPDQGHWSPSGTHVPSPQSFSPRPQSRHRQWIVPPQPLVNTPHLPAQVSGAQHAPQSSVPPQPSEIRPHEPPQLRGTQLGQLVTVPLQSTLVAVTLHGKVVHTMAGPFGQSSSHCVMS